MHLLLTDRLSCPRCGPEFGLILLAHEVRNRRILSGDFGCANCRETYPVEDGFGDLRAPPRAPLAELLEEKGVSGPDLHPGPPSGTGDEEALRLGALMGVTEGPGTLLLEGPAASHARAVATRIGGVEVVALNPALRWDPEEEGVSRMVADPGLPFFSGSLRAVLLSGRTEDRILEESVRVLIPGGRVVVLDAPPGAGGRLEAAGIRIVLEQEGVLVGERRGSGSRPLVTLRGS
jgi:uncharacterized protein YbaR (Trm112 family)